MGAASFVQSSFAGGEWSQTAQGDIADPKYKISLAVCLNAIVTETGAWTRRPGSVHGGTTRSGAPGRVVTFDFQENAPYNMEFTSGFLRFWAGGSLISINESITVTAVSTDNPAKLTLSADPTWTTGQQFFFSGLGQNNPLLQSRVFIGTRVDATHITITDALTGANIDGSTLGTFVSGTIKRVMEIATPWVGSDWQELRSVQTGKQSVLLHSLYDPRVLQVVTEPSANGFATFSLDKMNFIDGPYLDAPTNGVTLTPGGTRGVVTLTAGFPAYSSTKAYKVGDFVVSSSLTYKSILDNNINNTPASSPTYWQPVDVSAGIGPNGFTGSDIGRAVRINAGPADWDIGGTYSAGTTVAYAGTYWTALATSTGKYPGADLTNWQLNPNAAYWSWGRITGLLNQIPGGLSGSVNIGTLTNGGGLPAGFDGALNKISTATATDGVSTNFAIPGVILSISRYIGKNYTSATGGAQKVLYATVYPSSDLGLAFNGQTYIPGPDGSFVFNNTLTFTVNLYGSQSAPTGPSDGTLLGTQTFQNFANLEHSFNFPVTVTSSDASTAFKYVWVALTLSSENTGNTVWSSASCSIFVSQVVFFSPSSGSVNSGAYFEILGPDLATTNATNKWRLGVYSQSTGFPTCGTYHEGRLWLSGALPNRIDGSVPNSFDTLNNSWNFAPTETDGTVTPASGISYTFDAPDVNAIFWMQPEQQGIICGTQAGEWLVQATTLNSPLTALNIQAHRVTKIRCANIEPRRTDHTIALVHTHKRKLVEYFADVYSGKFIAPNLSDKVRHIMASAISEIAWQQEPVPVLWSRMADGSFAGMTYKRDTLASSQGPNVNGWHRHALGSGRQIASVCVGPSSDGTLESLSMVTVDPTTSIYHVEFLSNGFEEGSDLSDAWFVDNGIAPSSYAMGYAIGGADGIVCNGLWDHNGKTVSVFAGGLDVGDWPVTNGSVSVPLYPSTLQANPLFTLDFVNGFAGAMPIVAGFTYASKGQLLPPDTNPESGAHNGPGFGKIRRMHKAAVRLVNTQAISFGTRFDANGMKPAILKTAGGTPIAANALFTGVWKDNIQDNGEGYASQLCWEVTRPFPATVANAGGFLQTQDE